MGRREVGRATGLGDGAGAGQAQWTQVGGGVTPITSGLSLSILGLLLSPVSLRDARWKDAEPLWEPRQGQAARGQPGFVHSQSHHPPDPPGLCIYYQRMISLFFPQKNSPATLGKVSLQAQLERLGRLGLQERQRGASLSLCRGRGREQWEGHSRPGLSGRKGPQRNIRLSPTQREPGAQSFPVPRSGLHLLLACEPHVSGLGACRPAGIQDTTLQLGLGQDPCYGLK